MNPDDVTTNLPMFHDVFWTDHDVFWTNGARDALLTTNQIDPS